MHCSSDLSPAYCFAWPVSILGPVRVRVVTATVPLGQYFAFLSSVSLRQCCIINCILILLLSEGQAGEAWEASKQTALFRISEDHWLLKIGPTGCPETSVRNYYYSLRNNLSILIVMYVPFCVFCLIVLFCVLFVCTVLLPPVYRGTFRLS
jgi:hypothetical protein